MIPMRRRMRVTVRAVILLIWGIIAASCSEKIPDRPKPNQPPETHLSLYPEGGLHTTTSRQILHWWGDDPDGRVVGFIYTWEANAPNLTEWTETKQDPRWTFTTANSDTFALRFLGADTVYTFRVKAVDDLGAADPTPAVQSFPVANTAPKVTFRLGTFLPETTFTVAAFTWDGTDLDGDDTIQKYEYALDDTLDAARWREVPGRFNAVVLREADGLTEGDHRFFIRAVDIAGARSKTIQLPEPGRVWHVRRPRGRLLIIDDYATVDNSPEFYKVLFDSLFGEYTVWDIKLDRNRDNRPDLLPSPSLAFTESLLLFDRIFWYGDGKPHVAEAAVALPNFLDAGGKILFSAAFSEDVTGQLDFSPMDSLGKSLGRLRPVRLQPMTPLDIVPVWSGYPTLGLSAVIDPFFPLKPKVTSEVIYTLPDAPPGQSWPGRPEVAVIDATRSFVFFGLPLHKLDGYGTVRELITKIFVEVFGEV